MRLLLDTHIYLWWLADDPRLTEGLRELLGDSSAIVHVSSASIWEAAIKSALGKLDIGGADLVAEIGANAFEELPVSARHAATVADLPGHHRDPFDRMLIAQAQCEDLTMVTTDTRMRDYDVRVLEQR